MSILEEPTGRGEQAVEPKGRKAALSPPQVSMAQKWCTVSPATRHHQHHCSPHIRCPVTRAEHRSLFPLYGRSFLRHLKLSTIVYRANYFIFIVNLSMEEPISKTGLQYIEPPGTAESWPQDRPRGAPACRGTARAGDDALREVGSRTPPSAGAKQEEKRVS